MIGLIPLISVTIENIESRCRLTPISEGLFRVTSPLRMKFTVEMQKVPPGTILKVTKLQKTKKGFSLYEEGVGWINDFSHLTIV